MNGAILHFEPIFSKWDQSIFLSKTLKRIKSEIKVDNMTIPLYLLPINIDTPSEKAMDKFTCYLKEEKVDKVLLTDAVKKLPICKKIKNGFYIYDGKPIINYYLIDILKKCSFDQELSLQESTLVLISDSPEQVKEILVKCCSIVKDVCIDTKHPERFEELRQSILESYGIYVSFSHKRSSKDIIISLEDNQKPFTFSMNQKSKIIFYNQKLLKDFLPFIECNQEMLEFFVEKKFNSTKRRYIQQFNKDYPIVIAKIKNND